MSHDTCHVSHVTCHMSNVICHMSQFILFYLFLILDTVVKLSGGGSVINGAYPVYFLGDNGKNWILEWGKISKFDILFSPEKYINMGAQYNQKMENCNIWGVCFLIKVDFVNFFMEKS